MPLKVRHLGTADENILSSPRRRLLLFDLQFYNVGRMLNHFRYIRNMTRPNFAQNALCDPNNAAGEPIALDKTKK